MNNMAYEKEDWRKHIKKKNQNRVYYVTKNQVVAGLYTNIIVIHSHNHYQI